MNKLDELDQILGELVEKLDSAGKVMMGSAKEIADSVKIKGELYQVEKDITGAYAEIGEFISDNYRDSYSEDETLSELFSKVDELKSLLNILEVQLEASGGQEVIDKLDNYRMKTLDSLKSVTKVVNPNIDSEPKKEEFDVVDESEVICKNCGKVNSNEVVYCIDCGEEL